MRVASILAISVVGACASAASQHAEESVGSLRISEILVNPAGGDNGREFFELSGPPNMPLVGLAFVVIEGDSSGAGAIDHAFELDGLALDPNGIFLWRDAAGVIDNLREPGIQGPGVSFPSLQVQDFDPDLENGTSTFLLVQGFRGSVGGDLDPENDGVLNVQPWDLVVFGVSWTDGGPSDRQYAQQLGGFGAKPIGFGPNAFLLGPEGRSYFFQVTGGAANGSDWNLITPSTNFFSPDPGPLPREAIFMNPGIPFPARLCADQNLDDLVTPADFNAWILNFNSSSPFADVNMDEKVTPADFNAWILAFNQGQNGPECIP